MMYLYFAHKRQTPDFSFTQNRCYLIPYRIVKINFLIKYSGTTMFCIYLSIDHLNARPTSIQLWYGCETLYLFIEAA